MTYRGSDSGEFALTPRELATRWRRSLRTLERWRLAGTGPAWMRVGGRVLYRRVDVERFEASSLRDPQT